jgi:hypothetical protein
MRMRRYNNILLAVSLLWTGILAGVMIFVIFEH